MCQKREERRTISSRIRRHSHQLRPQILEAQPGGDGRDEQRQRAEWHADTKVDEIVPVQPPVCQRLEGIRLGHAPVVTLAPLNA